MNSGLGFFFRPVELSTVLMVVGAIIVLVAGIMYFKKRKIK